jgi:4-amino-4-deoxy-L-arabinose transferase-like glycosyltransferase
MMKFKQQHHLLITAGIVFLFILAGWVTLPDYGMGWDEIVRWRSGDLKLEYYQKLFSGEGSEMRDAIAASRYPGLFDMTLASYHEVFGGNRLISGHFLTILFGALGVAATAWLAYSVFGSKVAMLSALFLVIFPRFYGHSMINPKDIPFMATYTLGLAGVFWLARRLLTNGEINWRHFIVCGIMVGLAGSSRVPGLVLLALGPSLWTVSLFWLHRDNCKSAEARKSIIRLIGGSAILAIAAFSVVLIFFPRLHFQLFSSFSGATTSQLETAGTMPLLYNGEIMDAKDGPFAYPVRFFFKATPVWMIILLVCGCVFFVKVHRENLRTYGSGQWLQVLFLLAAVFPWCYVVLSGASLHDGIRHVLFCIPPLFIIMAFGAVSTHEYLKSVRPSYANAGTVVLIACVLLQVVNLYRMHPYQYVFFNISAGPKATIPNRYDTEYWCTSSKHLLEELPGLIELDPDNPTKIRVSGALDSARSFVPKGAVLVDSFEEADYYVSNTNFRIDAIVDGEIIYLLERGGIPIGVIKQLPKPE